MIEKPLKFLSKFIGGSLITLAVTLFLFSFFISYNIEGVDDLKGSLQNFLTSNLLLSELAEQQNIDLEELESYCNLNPDDENCLLLQQQGTLLQDNPEINNLIEQVKGYNIYATYGRIGAIVLFLIGVLLIYLGTFDIKASLYKVSFNSTVSSGLAILYYRFLPSFTKSITSNLSSQLPPEIPPGLINSLTALILNWMKIPINKVTILATILTMIFLVITVALFIIKRKDLKEKTQAIKSENAKTRSSEDTRRTKSQV